MSEWAMKRFWKAADIAEAEDGYSVLLDGRPVRSPAKTLLTVPTQALARAIAEEWQAQEDKVDPTRMPFTRMSNSALDKVRPQRAEVADMLAAYGDSDLLCYRAHAPADLVDRQQAGWDPVLDWAHQTYGARLRPVAGVMYQPQDPTALALLTAEVHLLDPFALAAFHDLVSMSGSLVLGLATVAQAVSAEQAWTLSRIDETWQEEQWGEDEDASKQAAYKRAEFLNAEAFLRLVRIP